MVFLCRLSKVSILLICLNFSLCLRLDIKENHNIAVDQFKTRINKRDITQFFDKASYSFNGFEKIESVPITFPLDICLFKVNRIRHAACLHLNKVGIRSFVIFRSQLETYDELFRLETPLAIGMDCVSFGQKGFVALAYNITDSIEHANKGSPIFQVDSERIKTIQYFGSPNLRSFYLRSTANELFLLQTFENKLNSSANLFCPYFKWSGHGFDKLGRIPCSNARRLEPFYIDSDSYVAVANYADKYGQTQTNSEIYKYDREKKKLVLFQKIKTNGAVDVKHFSVSLEEVMKQHFLVFGNSLAMNSAKNDELQADSVIYKYDQGRFVPYQSLPLYAVRKFLPVENVDLEKFILLVACTNQDVKIFNLNDWKFEESHVQFTEGALGKGVSYMRLFEDDEKNYLVIANERMTEDETNVFLPIFTQEKHANTLRQQIIDWSMATTARLQHLDVEKLKKDVEEAAIMRNVLNTSDLVNIPSAQIAIAYTRSLTNPKRNFTSSYWKTLSNAYKAIEALEDRLSKKLTTKRHISEGSKAEYIHETLNVGTLLVRHKLQAKNINGINPSNVMLKIASAPKIVVNGEFQRPKAARSDITPQYLDTLSVDHLKVSGKLNELHWADIEQNTLKKFGIQSVSEPVKVFALKTETLVTNSGSINGQNISNVILIDGGTYVIDQDVQFSKPIYASKMTISERLNNINVHQDKLDALLVDSQEVQHITGQKTFENLKMLEPVMMSGKIIGGFNKAPPFKPIHQSMNLTGDFTITGDVFIKGLLSAENIIGSMGSQSLRKVLDHGLSAFGPFDGLKLNFESPIEANNTIAKFVNDQDMQHLIRTDLNEVQIIEGHKTFKGDLQIVDGFAEVRVLNDINVDQLEKRILKRSGQQNITGNLKFKKVVASRIKSASIRLQGKDLSEYLTTSGNQISRGSLKIDKLKVQSASLENLLTENMVFGHQFGSLSNQVTANQSKEIFDNHQATIHVQNLKIGEFLNDNPIENIERLFTQLSGNVKYVGGMKFYNITVSNLTFTGKFNGIPSNEFGKCWLEQGSEQVFTGPLTIASVSAPQGLNIIGKLNERKFEDFLTGTYMINRDEHIENAVFENSVAVTNELTASTVNGLRIPEDILVHSPTEAQVLNDVMICQKDVHVKGSIRKLSSINNLNLEFLRDYLGRDFDSVTVQHAVFKNPPSFITLNSHNIRDILDTAWLANTDVDLQHHVEIADGFFEGSLDFEGPINGVNLKYLQENYFSLTKPQQVSAEMIFSKPVVFENEFQSESLHLYGPIIDATSNAEFDFNDFVENTFLKSGEQKITGQWKVLEGVVNGDLNDVQINDLNLAEDVVRYDVSHNKITASKRIKSASIKNLYNEPGSTVNGVNLSEWAQRAVFIHENCTIRSTTTLDIVTFRNDIKVIGAVNNLTFDDRTLLLCDRAQVIHGNVNIFNKPNKENQIIANSIEDLNVVRVNGKDVNDFFSYQCVKGSESHIKGSLTFAKPVKADYFNSSSELNNSKGSSDGHIIIHNKTIKILHGLKENAEMIQHSHQGNKFYISHFEHKQTMHAAAKAVISLTLRVEDSFVDVIGVLLENDENHVIFYRWDFYQQKFFIDKHLSWLPHKKALVDILRAAFGKAEYLVIEKWLAGEFGQNVVSTETGELQEIFESNSSRKIEAFEQEGKNCFVVYKDDAGVLRVYCVDVNERGLQFVPKNNINRSGVMQIVSLEVDTIAVLLADCVEIWKPNEPEQALQKISTVSPSQIAAVVSGTTKYIAICSKIQPKSFHHGYVDIYISQEGAHFQHMQTIDIVSPLQVEFARISESQDILLYILSESFDEPLAIYQYKGVVGFQPIVSSSTISPGITLSVIHLKASQQHLLAVMSKDDITLLETVLNKI